MKYESVVPARFLSRPNRFIAKVELAGREETVHVKNTGRCKELLLPGATVWLEESDNPARKTRFDLVAVENRGYTVNMDSQAPNAVFAQWARSGGYLSEQELQGAEAVLDAAALTYVASAVSSLLQLVRLLLIARRRDD